MKQLKADLAGERFRCWYDQDGNEIAVSHGTKAVMARRAGMLTTEWCPLVGEPWRLVTAVQSRGTWLPLRHSRVVWFELRPDWDFAGWTPMRGLQ